MTGDIDFVQLWVDGNDKNWRAEKSKYDPNHSTDDTEARYRDWDTLHYWFRSVEKFAPWVRKIHLLTWGHYPKWLNLKHPKLNFVKHSDCFPPEYLPTFNSDVLELNMYRIKELSDKFVYFNDDMFITKKIEESDFFKNGLPCDMAVMNAFIPLTDFSYIDFNGVWVINQHFKKNAVIKKNLLKWYNPAYGTKNFNNLFFLPWKGISRFISWHLATPHLKKTFQEVWDAEGELLDRVSKNKFRSREDVCEWLFRYWRLMKGDFFPSSVSKLGKFFRISANRKDNDLVYKSIREQKYKIICLNDTNDILDFEAEKQKLKETFECIFPEKSSYEL